MTDKAKLLELADRCEAATGPDPDLERAIKAALLGREYISFEDDLAKRQAATPPRYTASLDAAATLVPEGYNWQVGCGNHAWATVAKGFPPSMRVDPIAATPALALCSGALRARAEQAG